MIKKILLLLLLILSSGYSKAQVMVVNDPAATKVAVSGWAKSLSEAAAQSKVLIESKTLLKQTVDMYSQVSSTIQNIQSVHNIIDRQVRMISILNKELSRKDITDLNSYARYINTIQSIIIDAQSTISMLNSFLSPALSLSPGERLKLVLELDQQSKEQLAKIQNKVRMFNQLNSACRMLYNIKGNKH